MTEFAIALTPRFLIITLLQQGASGVEHAKQPLQRFFAPGQRLCNHPAFLHLAEARC
jgi:hypothetical protein